MSRFSPGFGFPMEVPVLPIGLLRWYITFGLRSALCFAHFWLVKTLFFPGKIMNENYSPDSQFRDFMLSFVSALKTNWHGISNVYRTYSFSFFCLLLLRIILLFPYLLRFLLYISFVLGKKPVGGTILSDRIKPEHVFKISYDLFKLTNIITYQYSPPLNFKCSLT